MASGLAQRAILLGKPRQNQLVRSREFTELRAVFIQGDKPRGGAPADPSLLGAEEELDERRGFLTRMLRLPLDLLLPSEALKALQRHAPFGARA